MQRMIRACHKVFFGQVSVLVQDMEKKKKEKRGALAGCARVCKIFGTVCLVAELIHGFDSNVANWHGKFVDSMTVSYGWVFSTERNWGSAYEISKAADARMYQSKERYYKESGADRR